MKPRGRRKRSIVKLPPPGDSTLDKHLTRLTWRQTRQTRLTWRLTCRTAHNTLAENGFEMKGPPRHLDATGGEQERGDWSTDYLLNGRLTSTTAESNTVLSKRASPKVFLAVLRG